MLLVKLLGRLVGAAAGLVVDEEGGSVPVVGEAVDLAFKEEVPYRHSEGHFGATILESGKTAASSLPSQRTSAARKRACCSSDRPSF